MPSGAPPRRKIPLIRIALLIGLGLFLYNRFDDLWPRVRDTLNPVTLWQNLFPGSDAATAELNLKWASDSSRVTLDCPGGLTAACCSTLNDAAPDLCGEATSLLAKAHWKRRITNDPVAGQTLHLESRAVVSDLGDWSLELAALRGRDAAGSYHFRYATGSGGAWCDARRGCLREPLPRSPLLNGRIRGDTEPGTATWDATSPRVRTILPGRVAAVDTLTDGTHVRVYHGQELYVRYGPLSPATGVRAGALVKTGSYLGDARLRDASGRYRLVLQLRQAGLKPDPETFWNNTHARIASVNPSMEQGS